MSEHSVFRRNVLRHRRYLIVTLGDVGGYWPARLAHCLLGDNEFTQVWHASEDPLARTVISNLASHGCDFSDIVIPKGKGVTDAVRKPFHSYARIDAGLSPRAEGSNFCPDQEFKVAQRPLDGRCFLEANVVWCVNNDLCRHRVS